MFKFEDIVDNNNNNNYLIEKKNVIKIIHILSYYILPTVRDSTGSSYLTQSL